MEFKTTSRTIGAKYGKNKGRAQIQNLHDLPSTVTTALPALKRFPLSPASMGAEQQDRVVSEVPADPPSPSPAASIRPAHVTSHSSSFSTSHGSPSESPTRPNKPSFNADMSTYDLVESDDELEVMERRPIKKLRVSPVESEKKRVANKNVPKPLQKAEKTARIALAKKQENISTKDSQESLITGSAVTKTSSQVTSRTTSESASVPLNANTGLKPKPIKATYGKSSKEPAKKNNPDIEIAQETRPTLQKSRTKLKSRVSGSSTPKKESRPVNDSDASAGSPSQLGFDHLRLTTEDSPDPLPMFEPSAIQPATKLPRGRKRLIDRLDAASTQQPVRADVAASNFAKEIERLHHGSEKSKPLPVSEAPKLNRTGSSQTRQTYSRVKNTYAKERSHLSDMVDELDAMSTNSSQDPSQQFLSGLLTTGPSQIQSQLELESDSSEDAPTYRLKSIYELKQAGTNSRLEKEVEDLMADVNPTGGSKALRIQALMQIMRRMSQEGFAIFLSEYALDRFTVWSSLMKDKISKLLLGMVFWRLVQCSTTSPLRLKQVIQCVIANSSTLPPLNTVAEIAKTRAENLSKSTIRDLIDFEQTVVLDGLLPAYEGDGVIPAAITIGVLNDSLRKIIDVGTMITLPQSSYTQIIALLQQVSQPSDNEVVKHVFVTKLALSLLQICAGPLEQDLGLSQAEYQALGDTLGDIVHRSLNVHETLVQSILHFAITLCNDKPEICQAMCQSNLIGPLMTIIRTRFLNLVDTAEDSQTIEATMLDSIILTLACLLNLTEHDHSVRRTFATSVLADSSTTHLSRLVDIYMEAAPRLKAVKTMAQGSALVVVGYLSLLICNLCLDEELWQAVFNRLNDGYSMSDVVASAKELLIHLRTVENANESGGSDKGNAELDGFTMRFGEILSAVKLE